MRGSILPGWVQALAVSLAGDFYWSNSAQPKGVRLSLRKQHLEESCVPGLLSVAGWPQQCHLRLLTVTQLAEKGAELDDRGSPAVGEMEGDIES